MAEYTQWEYRTASFGSFWSEPKDEELDAALNEWGTEGWEVVSVYTRQGTNKTFVVAKRPLKTGARRQRGWP